MFDLRPYQHEAVEAIAAAEARGLRRVIAAMATGAGKTVVFAHLIARRGQRALVLAHRDELIDQAVRKIRRQAPELTCGVVKGSDDQVLAQVVVASVQTLARPERLERLIAAGRHRTGLFRPALGPIGLVVVDECHHYVGQNTFGQVLGALGSHDAGGPLVVGFTATPERADRHALGGWWQEIVYRKSMLDGIREGWLVTPRAIEVQLAVDFNRLHVRAGDYVQAEVEGLLREADAPQHVLAAYLEHAAGRKAIAFTVGVRAAHEMADAFRAAGVSAEAVDGKMPLEQRRAVLARLAAGETTVCCNAQVLTEGFDDPSVSCIILARPTRSRVLAIQAIGRGLRLHPGKADCLILDCVGVSSREDLVTARAILEPERTVKPVRRAPVLRLDDVELTAVQGAPEEQLELAAEPEPEQGQLVYREVDLLTQSRLNWVQTRHGQWVLSMGKLGTVHVAPRGGDSYDVVRVWQDEATGAKKRATVRAGLTLAQAHQDAEERVRRAGATSAAAKNAHGRDRRPTDAQAQLLSKLGLHVPRTLGEASNLIAAHITRPV